jgi:hypothetical protein
MMQEICMKKKLDIRIDFDKNTKLFYYAKNILRLFSISSYFQKRLIKILQDPEELEYIYDRVNYYNKLTNPFELQQDAKSIKAFRKHERKKTYYFDLFEYLRYFKESLKISYLFGDIIHVPDTPSIVKSRPIQGDNAHSILMKLNKIRHFVFVKDSLKFKDKKDMLVWRGKCHNKEHRIDFVKQFYNHPLCDVGQTNTKDGMDAPWQKKRLSLKKQLRYKFILAIEGNDVASNLKWAMSSNSLVMMTQPKYETWFMEGRLRANRDYVLLKNDYSDLESKILYYSEHHEEAHAIIANANVHVAQFKNNKRENLISLLVLKKYFEKSNQLKTSP